MTMSTGLGLKAAVRRLARRARTIPLIAAFLAVPVLDAAILGSIRGLVRDERGIPQIGALVTLLTADGSVAKRVYSNHDGLFAVEKLFPGNYSIRVSLDSFLPVTKAGIEVISGSSAILDVSLRGLLSTLQMVFPGGSQVRDMSDDWKWVLRTSSSTRPVLRYLPSLDDETKRVIRRASGRFADTHGYAQVSAGAGTRQTALANESDLGTAFAVATSMFGNNDVVVSGNLGYGSTTGVPAAAFRTSFKRDLPVGAPEVSLTVRQLQMPSAARQAIFGPQNEHNGPALQTVTLGFADAAKLGESMRFEYGFLYESVRFLNRLNFVSPYGRLVYELGDRREIHVRYASGVPHAQESVVADENESLRRQVSSLGLFPRVAVSGGRPTVQRTEHVEISYREKVGEGVIEAAVYEDSMSDAALSTRVPQDYFADGDVLPDLFSASSTLNAGRFHSSGYRVSYARRIKDRLQAAIGYGSAGVLAPTTGQLEGPSMDELRRALAVKRAQLVTASISTEIPKSGTFLLSAYQWSSVPAVIAPDVYNDFASRSDPGLNLIIRQPLPFSGGLPGKLEATANFSNLLKTGYTPIQTHDGQQMYLFQAIRNYRGALSFIF